MCVISTTAGYQNLSPDFNLFLVGDATLATFPAVSTPGTRTQAALCFASLNQMNHASVVDTTSKKQPTVRERVAPSPLWLEIQKSCHRHNPP